MDTALIVAIIVIAVVAVLAIAGYFYYQQQERSKKLRRGFGSEYDRAVTERGTTREAEKELEARQKRVEKLHIRDLQPEEQERFGAEWRQVQARFVDNPSGAIAEADELICQVMEARGYPMSDFEQRAADVSVDHPDVVRNYRAAHDIALRSERDEASTEELRQAMMHYRALFEDLLETRHGARTTGGSR